MSDDNPYRPQDVVIHEQPETGVFVNPRGQIIVRQNDYFEGDSAEHVLALIAAIRAAAASPEAGFRQLEEEPELDLEPAPERIEDVPRPETIYTPPPDRRELIRVALLAGGKSNRQIAAELNCSEATVRRAAATLTAAECDFLNATPCD
jgi:hypothetical protein